jgi:DNA replication and repair protein RecF
MITPSDTGLIHEGSESRRKFIDGIISQFDKNYLDILLQYTKAVQQRNALLKRFAETNSYDKVSIDIWDQKLIRLAPQIFAVRKEFISRFIPVFEKYFRFIAGSEEKAALIYQSQLNEHSMNDLLAANNDRDRALRYTSVGPHKDDFEFTVNNFPLKKFGSQGQQKSFIVAAKLAQYEHIKKVKGYNPIILLDDIFDKLDQNRVEQIMVLVSENNFGQIFITDTQQERIEKAFEKIAIDKRYFQVNNGEIAGVNP